jgi:hypothetical protein
MNQQEYNNLENKDKELAKECYLDGYRAAIDVGKVFDS